MEAKTLVSANAKVKLDIAQDEISAYLTLSATNEIISEKEISDLLEEAGINFGLKAASEFRKQKNIEIEPDKPFLIALGEKQQESQVEFSLMFEATNSFSPGKFKNEFSELNKLEKAEKNQPLAHLFVTKMPTSGKNVYGNNIIPQQTEEQIINKYLGENVYYMKDRSQLFAKTAGYPYVDELSRVCIKNTFVYDGNLGLETENFTLSGNLVVNGDVKDKIKIRLSGDLIINGDINDASVHCDGDINVNGNISFCMADGILAAGNISYRAAENSKIVAGKKINFTKNTHFCKLVAQEGVFGHGELSSIVGGSVLAGTHIEVGILGNSAAIATEAEITISPYVKEIMQFSVKRLLKLKENGENTSEIQNLEETINGCQQKLEEEINSTLLSDEESPHHIMVLRKVFPGVYVRILKEALSIVKVQEKVTFGLTEGRLTTDNFT